MRVLSTGSIVLLLTWGVLSPDTAYACEESSGAQMWDRVPADRRVGFSYAATASTLRVDLDGVPPAELVVAGDALGPEPREPASRVFVLGCRERAWHVMGALDLPIDRGWSGTIDETPGVRRIALERVRGVSHPFVRIEHLDLRGDHDPRFIRTTVVLAHMVGTELVVALRMVAAEETFSGPNREVGPVVNRALRPRRGRAPAFDLSVRTMTQTGVRRRSTTCYTEARFDGRVFVVRAPNCPLE